MRLLQHNKTALVTLFILLYFNNLSAQQGTITIKQDPKFKTILDEKRKVNSSTTSNDRYKIQIFYGDHQEARKILTEFKKNYNLDATIVFSSPNYKVQVGNFRTKIDADRNFNELVRRYPEALVIAPSK